MPAGTPLAPGRIPGRFAGLRRFPQGEIHRVVLLFLRLHPRSHPQFIHALAREFSIVLERADIVEHIAVPGPVSQVLVKQQRDHLDNLLHILCGLGLLVGNHHIQGGKILVHGLDETLSQGIERLAVRQGAIDDLVVYVGDVARVIHLVAAKTQIARHHVEHQNHAGVTDMAVVVHSDAADIHARPAGFDRLEFFLFPR